MTVLSLFEKLCPCASEYFENLGHLVKAISPSINLTPQKRGPEQTQEPGYAHAAYACNLYCISSVKRRRHIASEVHLGNPISPIRA